MWCVLLALALAGCLFDTREAEPPASGGSGCGSTALDDPLGVFRAMTCALETQQDAAYERAISTRFVFSPTQQDSLDPTFQGTGVYDNWNKTVEMSVLGLMLSDAQTIEVTFNPSILINQTQFVRYRVGYELIVVNVATPTDTTLLRRCRSVRRPQRRWQLAADVLGRDRDRPEPVDVGIPQGNFEVTFEPLRALRGANRSVEKLY